MGRQAKTCSAPGKVLLAGGYLVLDRSYTGLVFGLNARIHVHIQDLPTSPGLTLSEIIVKSPQFKGAEWRYGYCEAEKAGGVKVTQLVGQINALQSPNKFVETALEYALSYANTLTRIQLGSSRITILADSDYYSHGGSHSGSSLGQERFIDFHVPLQNAHKTGLGSSAALVTALTAAVLSYYLPPQYLDLETEQGRSRLHNLAQIAHCAAQGKIGSGFDVAAAVYGSCVYRRFSPSILESVGEVRSEGFSERLKSVVEDLDSSKRWDTEVQKSAIMPKDLVLLMCDVDCGSETVGMVKKVLSWRAAKQQEADLLWATLQKGNEELADELAKQVGTVSNYDNLTTIILTIRSMIREMSDRAGVPIEPATSTELIDKCCEIPGVVGGLVPGAGGFDAIALLVQRRDDTLETLRKMLETYTKAGDETVAKVRLLSVMQDDQGLKQEDPANYTSWVGE